MNKPPRIVLWKLLIYLSLILVVASQIARAAPSAGSRWIFPLLLLTPAAIHQLLLLSGQVRSRLGGSRGWRVVARLFSIVLGVIAAGQLSSLVLNYALHRYYEQQQPFIEELAGAGDKLCARFAEHRGRNRWSIGDPNELLYDEHGFIVTFFGGSLDIDGSTAYYDSHDRQWSFFHNDQQNNPVESSRASMSACPGS